MPKNIPINDDDEIIEIPDLDEQSEATSLDEEVVTESTGADINQQTANSVPSTEVSREKVTEKVIVKTVSEKPQKTAKERPEEKKRSDDKTSDEPINKESNTKPKGKLKKLLHKLKNNKKLSLVLAALVVVSGLLAIPTTRYGILGLFIKKSITITVVDSKTNKPVSEAIVVIDGKSNTSDGNGLAQIGGVRVGSRKISITKKYYSDVDSDVTVAIFGHNKAEYKLNATGRQVPVSVTNSITGKPIKDATITAGDSKAATDNNGQTVIVLSPTSQAVTASVTAEGFNGKDVTITVSDVELNDNKFDITPAGKVYFLSKKSGKIDVVKTNLDGSDREVVLEGTGNEDEFSTTLLASRDWKYLALHSRRDNAYKLYLIETETDKLTTIDEGDASFSPVGWYNQNFVFTLARNNVNSWQPKQQALKSYNAETKNLKTIDETKADGSSEIDYASENFGQVYILENELVYAKTWVADYYSGGKIVGKKHSINSVRPDGSDKKTAREFDARPGGNSYINSKLYAPQEIYFQVTDYTQNIFYEYEEGKLQEDSKVTIEDFNGYYPTFLISPSGNKTFWHEPRDGKNTLFIGDKNAGDAKEIATLSEYQPYGWFGEDYLLESKNGSELHVSGVVEPGKFLKISDYHKPSGSFAGYGYGYGGL